MKTLSLSSLLASACLVAVALASPIHCSAAALVDWGGDYVSADMGTGRSPTQRNTTAPFGYLYNYDKDQPISPSSAGYSGSSSTYYGAVQLTTTVQTTSLAHRVHVYNGSGPNGRDVIHISTRSGGANPGGGVATAQGMIFWKKEDFLNGFDVHQNLSLSDIDNLYVNVSLLRADGVPATVRFVVQSGDVWYMSERVLSGTKLGAAMGSLTLNDPDTANWAVWGVQSGPGALLDAAPTEFDVAGSSLTDITAVGFYFNGSYSLSSAATFQIDAFNVTTIPEIGSTALLGFGVLACFAAKRSVGR